MTDIVRFSVSLEGDLLSRFDQYCRDGQFATRSEAVRQLIHEKLTQQAWQSDGGEVAGTLTLVYDHHRPQLRDALMQLQHDHNELVVSTLHAHLTHDVCLEVIVLRGPSATLRKFAAQLSGLKGIFRGELVMASAAAALNRASEADGHGKTPSPQDHGHAHPHAHPHDHATQHRRKK